MIKRKLIRPSTGDTVLIGTAGVTMPGDWYLATVLWTGADDVLVHESGMSGEGYRQVYTLDQVRAIGDVAFLRDYQEKCRAEVAALRTAVTDAEHTLVAARDAVWARLDQLAIEPVQGGAP